MSKIHDLIKEDQDAANAKVAHVPPPEPVKDGESTKKTKPKADKPKG